MPNSPSSWSRKFNEPISPASGRALVSLRDAANYIRPFPKRRPARRNGKALMLVAELNGPAMFARIGIMRALNRGQVRQFNPARKDHHWGKRKLKRDQ
jgi:hypothetical protein